MTILTQSGELVNYDNVIRIGVVDWRERPAGEEEEGTKAVSALCVDGARMILGSYVSEGQAEDAIIGIFEFIEDGGHDDSGRRNKRTYEMP